MTTTTLGSNAVGRLGLGCMGMSFAYGPADPDECHRVLERALELGVNHWDTADMYGAGANETLIGPLVQKHRDKVFLATKFGNVYDRTLTSHQDQVEANAGWIVDGTPKYVRARLEDSLKRLGVDTIDLYYQHRVDRSVPVEETWGEMKRLVEEGKVRFLGISEASSATIRKANAVHPITALQAEYSLWTREIEEDVLSTVRELGIKVVAYSPLGRGFLTGTIAKAEDLGESDWRRMNPRFQGDNLIANQRLAEVVKRIAGDKESTPARVALAWLLAQGEDILPIPGTKRLKYLEDNAGAADLTLTEGELAELNAMEPASGARYPEVAMQFTSV